LTVTHCLGGPERYVEPNRFGTIPTIPSQPSLQACTKTMSPSPAKYSFKAMPGASKAGREEQRIGRGRE
jgi:hypothetical protein